MQRNMTKSTATWKKPVRQHGKSTATWKKHRNISISTRWVEHEKSTGINA
jgi:hypothetical protein